MAAKKRSAGTAAKKSAPKKATRAAAATTAAGPKSAGAKAGAKKAAIKLTDKQRELLRQVSSRGDAGYEPVGAGEARSLESLREKKVVKKLAKNKETGKVPYAVTKAGEKVLTSA